MRNYKDDEYWDAYYEAKQLDAEKKVEDAWEYAEKECMEQAREEKILELKEKGMTPDQIDMELDKDEVYDQLQETAREIFENQLDRYIDPCGCSDPCCPCSGTKKGVP